MESLDSQENHQREPDPGINPMKQNVFIVVACVAVQTKVIAPQSLFSEENPRVSTNSLIVKE